MTLEVETELASIHERLELGRQLAGRFRATLVDPGDQFCQPRQNAVLGGDLPPTTSGSDRIRNIGNGRAVACSYPPTVPACVLEALRLDLDF